MKKKMHKALSLIVLSFVTMLTSCGTAGSNSTAESTEEETTKVVRQDGQTSLTYNGHASVTIVSSSGLVIYIDPNYISADYSMEADLILVTHGHSDHTPCKAVKLKENGTKITYMEALHDGIYETFDLGDIVVEAVPAANQNHDIDKCVGYIVKVDGITIYHAGDTSTLDTMSSLTDYNIDYALYPIDGEYNMDAVEATQVANLIKAKNNIPIHEYDHAGSKKNENFTPEGRLILEYGQTIIIGGQ